MISRKGGFKPKFIALHKWKKEDYVAVARKVIDRSIFQTSIVTNNCALAEKGQHACCYLAPVFYDSLNGSPFTRATASFNLRAR
jgi:hypothetical protein